MKITYDTATCIVHIRLHDHQIDESKELMAGEIVDVDAKGRAIDFEILDASKRIENRSSRPTQIYLRRFDD